MLKVPYFFRGGIHPEGHKDMTARMPILTDLPLPDRLFLPLSMQSNATARPLVKAGDRVLKGQLVATSSASMSAHIHAPTSGKVLAIEDHVVPHPSGLKASTLIIECDGDDRWAEPPTTMDPFKLDPEQLANLVENAGIVGMGGAIFPASTKLRQGRRFEIATLLINGGECEPYLTTDDRLMRERAREIIEGARLVQYIIESYRVVIAIEDNKPEAIAALKNVSELYGSLEIITVPTLYPMGSAKQMIQAITGQEVPAGARSNDIGVLVHNVGTIYAIQQALRCGRPLISRVVTVAGGCVSKPRNVEALIGTPVSHLLKVCGGVKQEPAQLLMGGPMMGMVLPSADVPLLKGSNGVLALSKQEVNARQTAPCIRCGRCVQACPMGLMPLEMARFTRSDNLDGANNAGLRDCILCGSCAYVCPSHIPLVQYFEYAKGQQTEQRNSQRKADLSKKLVIARNERQEREAAAKQALKDQKRRPKKATAATENDES